MVEKQVGIWLGKTLREAPINQRGNVASRAVDDALFRRSPNAAP
jgi:hypothetical protein